jgi:putative endonuclease
MDMERSTIEVGSWAEETATQLLLTRGYAIIERNFRCRAGELDIIARDGDILVFVEVRSRANADHGHAAEMIGPRKQRQVARVARLYLGVRSPSYEEIRFDVVAITGTDVVLIQDAWRLG